jgi:hypothetical protein
MKANFLTEFLYTNKMFYLWDVWTGKINLRATKPIICNESPPLACGQVMGNR